MYDPRFACPGERNPAAATLHADESGPFARSRPRRRALCDCRVTRCRGPRGAGLHRFPCRQPLEPARRPAARRAQLGGRHRVDRARYRAPCGLRLGPLGGPPDRDPDHRRPRAVDSEVPAPLRTRRRERPRSVSDPRQRGDRGRADGRRRPARADRRPRRLQALRAVCALSDGLRLACGLGRDLEPELEPGAACRLDVGRRRRAADPSRPRALRRGRARSDRPCAALHGRPVTPRVRVPGAALRIGPDRPEPSAHGTPRPTEGELRHPRIPEAGADRAGGAQALRDARRRQRLELANHRRPEPRVVER